MIRAKARALGLIAAMALAVAAGACTGSTVSTCTADSSCAHGFYCGPSHQCTRDCAIDLDCASMGAGFACQSDGRCARTVVDGGTGDTGSTGCRTDGECDDGVFCNGAERCRPTDVPLDARGCGAANPARACVTGDRCDETSRMCFACAAGADGDHDRFPSRDCGGTDCDDSDPQRFPGNPEVCDPANPTHDEDCDDTTFGFRDVDGDGAVDHACCNGANCGTDCDDTNARRRPELPEVCDGLDNDCDGDVDEGAMRTFYRDVDGDGYGRAADGTMTACDPPSGYTALDGDCAPMNPNINPGTGEMLCDGLDDNCNGMVDEGLVGVSCTTGLPGACGSGTTVCGSGGATMCTPSTAPICTAGTGRMCAVCDLRGLSQTCNGCDYGPCVLAPNVLLGSWFGNDPVFTHDCGMPVGTSWYGGNCVMLRGPSLTVPHGSYQIRVEGTFYVGVVVSVSGLSTMTADYGGSGVHIIEGTVGDDTCTSHRLVVTVTNSQVDRLSITRVGE